MNDVGLNLSQFFDEGNEGTHVIKNCNSASEGTNVVHLHFAVMKGEIITLVLAEFTSQQDLLKRILIQALHQ
jgi:hypothetical protein